MDLRQQLKEKNEDIRRHCEKEKGLEEKIEKLVEGEQRLTRMEEKVINIGQENNLVKNISELVKSRKKWFLFLFVVNIPTLVVIKLSTINFLNRNRHNRFRLKLFLNQHFLCPFDSFNSGFSIHQFLQLILQFAVDLVSIQVEDYFLQDLKDTDDEPLESRQPMETDEVP